MGEIIKIACEGAAWVNLEDLIEFQGNLKSLSEKNYKKLKTEIIETGIAFPFRVWRNEGKCIIIGGHQTKRTLLKMKEEGYVIPQVPVSWIEARNLKEAKRRVLQDISQYGEIERQGLYEFVVDSEMDFKILDQNFDLPDTDMDSFRIEYFDDNTVPPAGCDEDEVPETPKECKVKLGDIFELGNHRLMCADSTSIDAVEKLMSGEKADITFTSPPYNTGCFGYDGGKDKYKGKSDNKTQDDYFDFLVSFTNIALEFSTYVFFNNQFLSGNRHALAKFFGHYSEYLKEVFPWIKNTAPPNVSPGVFTNRFEFFLCLEKGNSKKGFPVEWQGKYNNVIEGHTAAKENVTEGTHSATMPIYVPEWFIERLPFINTVYEPFGGSGSTLIACHKTNRKCFMSELDPHYCSVILNRWEKFSNKKAYLLNEDGTKTLWEDLKELKQ